MQTIFADDLTGACDVAAALGREVWVPIARNAMRHAAEVLVYDTETRNLPIAEAKAVVSRALDRLSGPVLYWKIDSLLRGNWAHELAEAMHRGAIERLLVAPAFPEQHRTTRGGIQYAHGRPVSEYLGSGSSSITEQLLAAGVPAARFRVLNSETFEDLRRAAEGLRPEETPVGSAGLARAMWGPLRAMPARAGGTVLVVVGTASDRGREQLDPLRVIPQVRLVEPDAPARVWQSVKKAFAESVPAALVVVGGDTLSGTARLLAFEGLLVQGEVFPGVALARIVGGGMDARQIVTKAGDFGERETLLEAVRKLL